MPTSKPAGHWLAEAERRKLLEQAEREVYPTVEELLLELYKRIRKDR